MEATGLCDQEGEAEEGRDHEEVMGLREGSCPLVTTESSC